MNSDRWQGFLPKLRELAQPAMTPREVELFCEVEAVLHLYQTIQSESARRDAKEAWALVSGYAIPEVNTEDIPLRMCLALRSNLRYMRTASAWYWWLNWYTTHHEALRLFQFVKCTDGALQFEQKTYDVRLRKERLTAYARLFNDPLTAAEYKVKPFATSGTYEFDVDHVDYSVEITEEMAAFAGTPMPRRDLPHRAWRHPILIHWDELLQTAQDIDNLETMLAFKAKGNWENRLKDLRLAILSESGNVQVQRAFTLDGLFHLVGALGVGKSSLIWVLAYLLARRSLHVTVVLGTVVEAYRFAAWLRRLGVRAAPALGVNRADHAKKVGLANAQDLRVSRIFSPDAPVEPILDWMPAPCALSGTLSTPIPMGQEPCNRLIDEDGNRHRCPLLPVCPVHRTRRDLVSSQVWIVNPMSLLYSSSPDGVGEGHTRLLQAIYRLSDVVIIDEADRVQVQWDRAFAPVNPLAGSDAALLDRLHRALGSESVGGLGRRRASQALFNRMTRSDAQANILANHAFRLLAKSPKNARWIKRQQFTNHTIFARLAGELAKTASRGADQKALARKLQGSFRTFWLSPLRRETGELAAWINSLIGTDIDEKRLQRTLELWLAQEMGWQTPLKGKHKLLMRRLELCLTISAMLKRTNDIYFQLKWIEDELNLENASDFEMPDEIVELVPDPPLGVLLGARLIGHHWERDLGVFTALRYRGVGRWLLLNLPHLYVDLTGEIGPHVLLTSATSWLPGASQFDLVVSPHAILLPEETAPVSKIDVHFKPVHGKRGNWIRVSGADKRRKTNLQQIVRELAKDGLHTPSDFQRELNSWREHGEPRRILLVVGSYEQTAWVLDALNALPGWQGRAARLLPDDTELLDEYTLRTREVEQFKEHTAGILIAPLMAIQRGFNILDELEGALLGSVYFLVRPYPPPDDLTPQVLSLNAWTIRQLHNAGRQLDSAYSQIGAMRQLRRRANREWHKLLTSGRRGLNSMSDAFYAEFLRDQFILIWQTIGRLLRGGRDAHVYFVDSAFSTRKGKRRMLLDWHTVLDNLIRSSNPREQYLAQALYDTIWDGFRRAVDNKEVY